MQLYINIYLDIQLYAMIENTFYFLLTAYLAELTVLMSN